MKAPKESTRAYIYSVIVVAIPVLVAAGVAVDSDLAKAILDAAAVVLGVGGAGLARANTSTKA